MCTFFVFETQVLDGVECRTLTCFNDFVAQVLACSHRQLGYVLYLSYLKEFNS